MCDPSSMDTIIVVFRDRPNSLLCKAMCFDADDQFGALAAYASLGPELRPLIYQAQVIAPVQLTRIHQQLACLPEA
jgi:hypothetical protein